MRIGPLIAAAVLALGLSMLLAAAGRRPQATLQPQRVSPDRSAPPRLRVEAAPPLEAAPPRASATAERPASGGEADIRPISSRPTREAILAAQEKTAHELADVLLLEDPVRSRFVADYLDYVGPCIDTDIAVVGKETTKMVIGQRRAEFDARVATYLTADQIATLCDLLKKR